MHEAFTTHHAISDHFQPWSIIIVAITHAVLAGVANGPDVRNVQHRHARGLEDALHTGCIVHPPDGLLHGPTQTMLRPHHGTQRKICN